MGVFGILNINYDISALTTETNKFYLTAGVFPIPILGGIGLSYKKYYSSSRARPYVSTTLFANYVLGLCANCNIHTGLMGSLAAGYDLELIKTTKANLHLQLGILSQLDLISFKVFESPSDKPEIWPVINLKVSKNNTVRYSK